MTPAHLEIARKILLKMATYDPRMRADEMHAAAWAEQVALSRLGLEDCLAAVGIYYRDHGSSPRVPLPADILTLARGIRNDRRTDVAPDLLPAHPDHVAACQAHMRTVLRKPRGQREHCGLQGCPVCGGGSIANAPTPAGTSIANAPRSFSEPTHSPDDESPFL